MPETPTVTEVNCETKQQTVRDMTPEEIANREAAAAAFAIQKAAEDAAAAALAELKASAKAKLVAGQPLTPEEADTLIL